MGDYKIWSAKTIDGEKNNHGYSQDKIRSLFDIDTHVQCRYKASYKPHFMML